MTTDLEYGTDTALVVVDVQNDFASPQGSLYVTGGEEVVAAVNVEVRRARDAGALIVYTQDWHPPQTAHFADQGGQWPRHCVRDTEGAELHPDLAVEGPIVRKGTGGEDGYSGFSVRDPETGAEGATALDGILREHDIRQVVITGLALDVCVQATALDAIEKGYTTTVLTSAARPVDAANGEDALEVMREAGVILR